MAEKTGRPSKLSTRDKSYCVNKIISDEVKDALDMAKQLKANLKEFLSPNTVLMALKIQGLEPIVKPKKSRLRTENVKERLAWGEISC